MEITFKSKVTFEGYFAIMKRNFKETCAIPKISY